MQNRARLHLFLCLTATQAEHSAWEKVLSRCGMQFAMVSYTILRKVDVHGHVLYINRASHYRPRTRKATFIKCIVVFQVGPQCWKNDASLACECTTTCLETDCGSCAFGRVL